MIIGESEGFQALGNFIELWEKQFEEISSDPPPRIPDTPLYLCDNCRTPLTDRWKWTDDNKWELVLWYCDHCDPLWEWFYEEPSLGGVGFQAGRVIPIARRKARF